MPATRSAGHAACADDRELQCAVAAFVAALPCKQRAALMLRVHRNLGYAEIAANLRCSAGEARATVYEVLRSLLTHGFEGPVFPVNPAAGHVSGVKAYADVRDIPDRVDLAVIAVPAPDVAAVVQACSDKDVRGLVVV